MKIWAFVAEIFAKQYWCFLIIDFQCNFDISAIMHLRSLQRWIITEWLCNFFETRSQNGPISVKWKHQSQLIFCILRLSHRHITFDSSNGTPCSSDWTKLFFQNFVSWSGLIKFYFKNSVSISGSSKFKCQNLYFLTCLFPCSFDWIHFFWLNS